MSLDGALHVDGGWDDLLGLASCSRSERVLSVDLHTVGLTRPRAAMLGRMDAARRAQGLVLDGCVRMQFHGVPFVGPTSMAQGGPVAYDAGRAAMAAALDMRRATWGKEKILPVPVSSHTDHWAPAASTADVATAGESLS